MRDNVPAAPMPRLPNVDILWKQYEMQIGLYKGYLELLLKFNVFYYAATGALVSYYFSKSDVPWMKYSLLFPVVMSAAFACLFIYAAGQTHVVRQELFAIRDLLGLGVAPEYRILTVFLWMSALLMVIVGFSLLSIVFLVAMPGPKVPK